MVTKRLHTSVLLSSCALLAACGGGGARPAPLAPPVTVAPAPTPTPSPTPTPTPSPSSSVSAGSFDTSEYRQSNAAAAAKAITAYTAGATGKGVKIGIVDSGINTGMGEFAGRIDPASQNVRTGGPVTATGFHGTAVAALAAAGRNDATILGVAFDSTIIALNSANPNDCNADGVCQHDNKDIARGVDIARASGARVINISLGGSAPGATLISAVQRATQAGIVVVFAAGNDSKANPDQLGLETAQQNGSGLVILAGALGTDGAIASFSNRAGAASGQYLMALGERVQTFSDTGWNGLYSGTSFAAPVISGAVALLASAFPNLSGAQIIELLFRTADDLGDAGVDAVYGRGALNLGRAFQPQGQTSLAGSAVPVTLGQDSQLSSAMGDAGGSSHGLGAVILDGYSRAFAVDLAGRLARAPRQRVLAGSLAGDIRTGAAQRGPVAVALTVRRDFHGQPQVGLAQAGLSYDDARQAKALAGYALGSLSKRTAIAFGFSESGRALRNRLTGQETNAFLVARDPLTRAGFDADAGTSLAVRQQFGRIGLTVSNERGQVWEADDRRHLDRPAYSISAVTVDRQVGPALLSVAASRLSEEQTVLGGRFNSAFTAGGSASWFLDGSAGFDLGSGWGANASYRRGWTDMSSTGVSSGSLATDAWSLDLAKASAFAAGDRLALRVMQPLRVASGGFDLNLPVSYDYASGSIGYQRSFFNLAPTGREIAFEAAYSVGFAGGDLGLNGFIRRQPGHIAEADSDVGAAMRFSLGF